MHVCLCDLLYVASFKHRIIDLINHKCVFKDAVPAVYVCVTVSNIAMPLVYISIVCLMCLILCIIKLLI